MVVFDGFVAISGFVRSTILRRRLPVLQPPTLNSRKDDMESSRTVFRTFHPGHLAGPCCDNTPCPCLSFLPLLALAQGIKCRKTTITIGLPKYVLRSYHKSIKNANKHPLRDKKPSHQLLDAGLKRFHI